MLSRKHARNVRKQPEKLGWNMFRGFNVLYVKFMLNKGSVPKLFPIIDLYFSKLRKCSMICSIFPDYIFCQVNLIKTKGRKKKTDFIQNCLQYERRANCQDLF